MTVATIKKRFPTSTVLALIALSIVIIVLLGFIVPGLGAALIGFGSWVLFDIIIGGLFWLATPQVAVALGLVGVVAFLWYYRRNYAKKKVIIAPTTGLTGGVDSLSKPLFDEDMKVESA